MRIAFVALFASLVLVGCSDNKTTTSEGPVVSPNPEADCGPQPGAPAIECDDGSIGGFTGQCLCADENDGTPECGTSKCAWEFRDCPEQGECSQELCGVQPGLPAYECGDGTIGGFTGRCLASGNECHWEILECP